MKYLSGAFAALVLIVPPIGVAKAENKVEVYYQGSVIPFGRAEKRFVCDNVTPIESLLTALRRYDEKKAYSLLREPVKKISDGAMRLHDDIVRLTSAAPLINVFCRPATKQLFIFAATAVEWFDDHEVTTVLVMDEASKVGVTYFLDIRVLYPMPDSLEAKRLKTVGEMLEEHRNAVESNSRRWQPLGEPR